MIIKIVMASRTTKPVHPAVKAARIAGASRHSRLETEPIYIVAVTGLSRQLSVSFPNYSGAPNENRKREKFSKILKASFYALLISLFHSF